MALETGMKRGVEKIKQEVSTLGSNENGWRVFFRGFGGRRACAINCTLRTATMAGIHWQ